MKKILAVLSMVLAVLCCLTVSACNKNETTSKVEFTIGILQLLTHDALGAAKDGFISALEDAGYVDGENIEIIVKNPEGDETTLQTHATSLVRDCDLVLGIATPAAQALVNARDNLGSDIPVLFTAVTDPVDAKLVESITDTSNNVTGTADASDVASQIKIIKKLLPDAENMYILYTSSESNSLVQANEAKKVAEEEGLSVVIKTVSGVEEISSTCTAIVNAGADSVFIPTDNLMASNISTISGIFNEAKILTVCGEENMVNNGGCVSYSIDYTGLGEKTGEMAVRILKGTAVTDVDVLTIASAPDQIPLTSVINKESIVAIGLKVADVEAALEG